MRNRHIYIYIIYSIFNFSFTIRRPLPAVGVPEPSFLLSFLYKKLYPPVGPREEPPQTLDFDPVSPRGGGWGGVGGGPAGVLGGYLLKIGPTKMFLKKMYPRSELQKFSLKKIYITRYPLSDLAHQSL